MEIIAKKYLCEEEYYFGLCRNARIARWDGERFRYWRHKFGYVYLASLPHKDDQRGFDSFTPFMVVYEHQCREIPLDVETTHDG